MIYLGLILAFSSAATALALHGLAEFRRGFALAFAIMGWALAIQDHERGRRRREDDEGYERAMAKVK